MTSTSNVSLRRSPMTILGPVIIAAVALYLLFISIDSFGLTSEQATVSIVDKGYRAAGTTYFTNVVNGRPFVQPQKTPEMWLLAVNIANQSVQYEVSQAQYDQLQIGDPVQIVYQRRRLTGVIQVVDSRSASHAH